MWIAGYHLEMKLKKLVSPGNLRVLLALIVLAAFLPALGLVLYTGLSYRNFVLSSVRGDALQSTRSVSGVMDDLVEGSRILLVTLSQSERVMSGDPVRMTPYFTALLRQLPQYANIGAIHTDGTIFASGVPLTQPVNERDQAYFQRLLATKAFAGGDYEFGRVVGKPVLIFAYPLLGPDGSIQNVLYCSLDLAYINQLAASQSLPPDSVLNLIDHNGTLLVRQPNPDDLLGQTLPDDALVRAMLVQNEGLVELTGLDRISRIYAFTTVRGTDNNLRLSIGIPRGSAYAAANHTLLLTLLLLVAVGLLALGGAALFSEAFILRRMRRLVSATDRLAAGDLSVRAGISRPSGELGRLASSFDAMAETLERHNAELEDYARKLQDFLDIAGHELRHPLTILSGYMQALPELSGKVSAEQLLQIRRAMQASIARLTAIVDDLLDVSRIESGRFPVRAKEVPAEALLAEALEEIRRKSPDREFLSRVASDAGSVTGDPTRLHQLIIILLDNAIAYSPASAPVELTAERKAGELFICCMDRGPGIPAEARERIFERFGEVADVDHHTGGGLGVGLYIARRIAEAHGGRLRYEPREGGGSRFCLSLPVRGKDD